MELKDTWKDLENYIEGVPDSGEKASADDINNIAHAVIDIENNKTTSISEKPSNAKYPTEKAVADYVSEHGGGGSVEIVDNLTSTDKDKALSANMGRELFETKVNKVENMGLSKILDIVYYSRNPATSAEESMLDIVYQGADIIASVVFYNKEQIDKKMGDIETALDSIIAIQNELIGGDDI